MDEKKNRDEMKMICPKCGYEWMFKGDSEYYASCPRCRKNINLKTYFIKK